MANVIRNIFLIILGIVVIISTFIRLSMNECKNYQFHNEPLNNKIMIITGANSGLGYYTALALAKLNAHVILTCRNNEKCEIAKQSIIKEYSNASIDTFQLDLSSFNSIKSFVNEYKKKYKHVDILINNAGIMAIKDRELTKDGLESQIGTNHFGHFLLTALLYPLLSNNGRIINHSSGAHAMHTVNFPFVNLQSEKNYSPWGAYGNSKAANLLFTFELNRKLMKSNNPKNIISVAVHPGYTSTNLQANKFPLWDIANNWFGMKGEDGALSQILAAIGPNIKPSINNFIGPKFIMFGIPSIATTKSTLSEEAGEFLWKESVRLTGVDIKL